MRAAFKTLKNQSARARRKIKQIFKIARFDLKYLKSMDFCFQNYGQPEVFILSRGYIERIESPRIMSVSE